MRVRTGVLADGGSPDATPTITDAARSATSYIQSTIDRCAQTVYPEIPHGEQAVTAVGL
jgi:hypothetical protein